MNSRIFFSCDEANITCDKAQYDEASLWEKIKMQLHLLMCAACRSYTRNNAKLTQLFNRNPVKLDPTEKEKIQATFEKELAKQNDY
ncbi:glycine dehydrogenase [Lacinutrix chionoecetis]